VKGALLGKLIVRWAPRVAQYILTRLTADKAEQPPQHPNCSSVPPRWGTDIYAMLQDQAPDLLDAALADRQRSKFGSPYGWWDGQSPAVILAADAVRALIDARKRLTAELEHADEDRFSLAAGALR